MLQVSVIGLILNIIKTCILASDEIGAEKEAAEKEAEKERRQAALEQEENGGEKEAEVEEKKKEESGDQKQAAAVRAAIINLLGDIFKSIGIIILSGILEWQPDWDILDPIYTVILSIVIIYSTLELAEECIHELVGGAPEDLDIKKLRKDLENIRGVEEVHDLHVWNLVEGTAAISVHILTDRPDRDRVLEKATKICHKYNIFHTTLQV